MTAKHIEHLVAQALFEDLNGQSAETGDITANLITDDQQVTAQVITREPCVLAGQAWVNETFHQVDPTLTLEWLATDCQHLNANQAIFNVIGSAKSILTAERTALNLLQTLSATATVTAEYVSMLAGSNIQLLDTRKTLPGMRMAQKYAVTCGGGKNHRIGLFDAFLIKENHILACGSIQQAVSKARAMHPDKKIEVEVENLHELQQAVDAGADIVMLDNFSLADLQRATSINNRRCKLEVSGNVTMDRLAELKTTGVDYISSGALTKNVQAIDLSMRIIKTIQT